ncbi:ABC-type nitrate/sulfonate/bicarbonate transport system, periplasmic component [Frankia canadensis]|uniref:ABC-type nitrate/sulfonate/bicarbonate transport system, periplasmic component n=1 Tax=Frankia canadensis TaxID=1836972 RepID=A0A2I2KS03_9ACTN|nr:ABC transporter substrate-binding protein [Frankia canadensis]SNQ48445.1 ABC-type nitrate/sulfonate/bicarbonate transport system, periplasmic component [Frankia canadensis]SOU55735.1 ABC-type nitrate/sulfonate/bicarbonate transport system, periplasmic component [Frankia canadensis]
MRQRRPRTRRPSLLLAGVAALVAVLLAACGDGGGSGDGSGSGGGGGAASSAPGRVTLRIGDQSKVVQLPLSLSGADRGTPYGLSYSTFADGPHMNAAFSAGRLDVGFMGDTPVLFANAAGAGAVAVAVQESPVNTQTIIARAGSGIRTPADLKGRRVAFTVGTSLHGYLLNQLDAVGLDQKDITPVNVPVTSLTTTLAGGKVDAIVYTRMYTAGVARQAPGSYEIQTRQLPVYSVLLASKAALKDPAKRAAVRDFVLRLSRASAWPKANAATWVQKYYVDQLKQDPVAARRYFDSIPDSRYRPVSPGFVESQRVQARLLGGVGVLPKGLDVNNELDSGFTTELTAAFAKAFPAA